PDLHWTIGVKVMGLRRWVMVVALSSAALVSGAARAADLERSRMGGKYPVRSVSAFKTVEDLGYSSYEQFRGAELFVPAQPGLTSEWPQRVIAFQIAAGECDLGVRDTSVSVLSAGSGFS